MKFLLAIMAGCLFALAYFQLCPTFFSVILPILASSLLLFSWSKSTAKQAFFTGWLFGAIFFGLGISWVYVSIHEFGNIPIFEASGITLLFAIFLGLFPALQGYFLNKIFSPFLMNFFNTPQQKRLYKTPYLGNYLWPYYLLAFPALGCLLELLKSWIFTGFPWLEAGVTQIHGPLSGFAPILGSYGCSLILYFIAGLLTYSFQTFKNIKNSADPINATGPHTSKEIIYSDLSLIKICFPLILIFLIFVIGQLLSFKAWTQIIGQPILVSLIQGNIPQSLKWDEKNVINSLHIYYQESQKLPNSRFIIWPETAIPLDQINAQEYLGLVQDLLQKNNPTTALITGIPLIQSSNQYGDQYFNAAIILGNGHGVYQKNHLVPFGEYIPLREIFGIIFEFLNVPMSDFTAGSLHQPLMQSGAISIANFICYETAYSNYVREEARDSNLMVALSDDAWFGDSAGPYQHLQINQMRALENGRYLLNSTNNGITAVITPEGKILKKIPQFHQRTLTTSIFAVSGETPWEKFGLWPVWIALFLMLGAALINISFRDSVRVKN